MSNNKLAVAAKACELDQVTEARLLEVFQPHFNQAAELAIKANAIKVTDATQLTEMKQAREMRLQIKDIRVAAEKTRVSEKAQSLRLGRGIDNLARVIIAEVCEPAEKALQAMEDFAVNAERERLVKVHQARAKALWPYANPEHYPTLGTMPDSEWTQLYNASKIAHESKIAGERAAQESREAQQKADREERERLRAENERMRAEREQVEAQARKDREAREALERKEQLRKDAEAKQRREEAKAKRKAERAPDREKLLVLVTELRAIDEPNVSIGVAENIRGRCMGIITDAAAEIERLVEQEFGE